MSLILDALKKAKDLAGRKPPSAPPTALASFRFGRPSRSEKAKRIALLAGMVLVIVSSVGYTANFWVKRLRKPRAVLIQAPRSLLPPDPQPPNVPSAQDAAQQPVATETPKPQQVQHETPTDSTPAAVPAASATPASPASVQVIQSRGRSIPQPAAAPPKAASLPATTPVPAPKPNPPARVPQNPVPPVQAAAAVPALNTAPAPKNAVPPPPPASPPAQPPSPTGPGEITPPSRDPFELAVFYQKSGDYLKALEQYNKVLEKDPLNASVYNNVGLIHYTTNNTLEAVKAFRQATYIDPKYDKAHNNLGLALRQAGQDAEAQREFERALQLNPRNAEALTNLAAMARKSGNIEQAKVQYLQAIQANPANAEAHYNLAVLYEEQGETGSAIGHFKKFLTLGSSTHPEVVADVERKIDELSKKR